MSEKWYSGLFASPLGKFIMGVIKLVLASFLIAVINSLGSLAGDLNIGGSVIPVSLILQIIIAFFPIMLLVSAMKDMGISL